MNHRWKESPLGEIAEIINGGTPRTKIKEYWDGNIYWITPKDLGQLEGRYVYETPRKITSLGLSKSSAKLLKDNSLILSTRAPIGHLAINKVPISTNQGCRGIVPSDKIDVQYLYYFLKSEVNLLNELGTGTTFKELSTKSLSSVKVPLPPIAEQQRIVEILDKAFAAIDQAKANIERNIANAQELFQSKLNQIFSQRGEGWEEKTLGEVYDVRDGTHDSPKYHNEGHPLITSKNLKSNRVTYDKVKFISDEDYFDINKRSKVDIGDVLFAMIGTIGNPIEIIQQPDFAIKNIALFKVPLSQNSTFLKYYLDFSTEQMINEAKGSTQRFVGLGYLRKFKINIPSVEIQKVVVKELSIIEGQKIELIKKYESKLFNLEQLKKSLLQKAFSGELTRKEVEV